MNAWIRASLRPTVRTSVFVAAVVLVLACIVFFIVSAVYGKTLIVDIDGKLTRITTYQKTVGEALAKSDLTIYPEDQVTPDRHSPVTDGMTVKIVPSKPFRLTVDGSTLEVRSAAATVGEALAEISERYGLKIGDHDEPSIARSEPLEAGMDIKVERAVPIRVEADGKQWVAYMAPRTVSEALKTLGIELQSLDKISLPLSHVLASYDVLKVTRVEEKIETIRTAIPYQTIAKPGDFALGLPDRVITPGKPGVQEQTVKIVYEDGKEVRREILAQRIVTPPVSQIVARGTLTQVSRGGQVIDFKRAYLMRATAYCEPGGITATGAPVRVGVVAVDPRIIPLGTKLYIEGYGDAIALDTGGAIKGYKIDLYMDSVEEARRWGVRTVTVYVK